VLPIRVRGEISAALGLLNRAGGFEAPALKLARAGAEQAGAQIETTQRAQPIIEGLLEEADERDAQMIVVGSTGEGPLRGLIVGSTPYKLLHASTRPVLVVPSRG
jgi:nucleotide-binding universal stress UspA family protein